MFDKGTSKFDINSLEKILTCDEKIRGEMIGNTRIRRVGDVIHIWLNKGNWIWVTNVTGLLSYVTKFKDDRNICLDIDMKPVENHVCKGAEVMENRFYPGAKENLYIM